MQHAEEHEARLTESIPQKGESRTPQRRPARFIRPPTRLQLPLAPC